MYVWEEAVKVLKHWQEIGRDDMYISVHISVKDFQNLDLVAIFSDLLMRYNINPKRLKLEITESVMMNDIASILETFSNLQKAGFEIEIDDFGSDSRRCGGVRTSAAIKPNGMQFVSGILFLTTN